MLKIYETSTLTAWDKENECSQDSLLNHYYGDIVAGNNFIHGVFFRLQDYGATDIIGINYVYSDGSLAYFTSGTNLWEFTAFDSNGDAFVWFRNIGFDTYLGTVTDGKGIRIVYALDNGVLLTTPYVYNCGGESLYLLRSNLCDYDCDGNYYGIPYDINGDPIPEPPNPTDNWRFSNDLILRCRYQRLPDTYSRELFNNCTVLKNEKTKHISLETELVPEWLMDSLGNIFDCGQVVINKYYTGIDTTIAPLDKDVWILKTDEPFSEESTQERCRCYFSLKSKFDSCVCTIYPNCNDNLKTICEDISLLFVSSTCLNTDANGLCIESEVVFNIINPFAYPVTFGVPYVDVLTNSGLVTFTPTLLGNTLTLNIVRNGNSCEDVLYNIVLPIAECDSIVLENESLPFDMVKRCIYIRENVVLFPPSSTFGTYDIDITYEVNNGITIVTNTLTYSGSADISDTFPNEDELVICIDKQLGDGFFDVSIVSYNVYNFVGISASSNIIPIVKCEDL